MDVTTQQFYYGNIMSYNTGPGTSMGGGWRSLVFAGPMWITFLTPAEFICYNGIVHMCRLD